MEISIILYRRKLNDDKKYAKLLVRSECNKSAFFSHPENYRHVNFLWGDRVEPPTVGETGEWEGRGVVEVNGWYCSLLIRPISTATSLQGQVSIITSCRRISMPNRQKAVGGDGFNKIKYFVTLFCCHVGVENTQWAIDSAIGGQNNSAGR